MTTGNVIKDLREKLRMSQREIGIELNVRQAAISRYELEQRSLPPDIANRYVKLAKANKIKLTLADIYCEE